MTPSCSFIVSAFDRPWALDICISSLRRQTCKDFEVIVTDNNRVPEKQVVTHMNVQRMGDRFRHMSTGDAGARDCYESANFGAEQARGKYLCFPSDDGYYAPRFLELMLRHGAGADLVFCNCVWDGRGYGPGEELIHLVVEPRRGKIDKGGFLVKRKVFLEAGGFQGPFGVDRPEDGALIERLRMGGKTYKKVEITGWIHN